MNREPNAVNSPLFGAALLGATGAGAFASVTDAASSCVRIASIVLPTVEGVAVYAQARERYARLHELTCAAR